MEHPNVQQLPHCSTNQLLMRPEETQFLPIGTSRFLKKLHSPFTLLFLGKTLRPVTNAGDLGIIPDSHVTYNEYIKNLVFSFTATLCQMNRVKDSFDTETLKIIISSLLISKFFYCSPTLSNISTTNISKLQAVHITLHAELLQRPGSLTTNVCACSFYHI